MTSQLSEHLAKQDNGGLRLAVFSMDGESVFVFPSLRHLSIFHTRTLMLITFSPFFFSVDLYLPYSGLKAVASSNASNMLLSGRGQPGTHDLPLGSATLSLLRAINDPASSFETGKEHTVHLPIFDKSAHGGYGDRSTRTVDVCAPLDVVLFEGWSLGFAPIGAEAVTQRWKEARAQAALSLDNAQALSPAPPSDPASAPRDLPCFATHPLSSLLTLDANLTRYVNEWYDYLDAFVQLEPVELENVFRWRLQAEWAMKEANGGRGMDDEVRFPVFLFSCFSFPHFLLFFFSHSTFSPIQPLSKIHSGIPNRPQKTHTHAQTASPNLRLAVHARLRTLR